MSLPWVKASRTLNEVHQEVKEVCACLKFKSGQLNRKQNDVLQIIDQIYVQHCLNYMQQSLYGVELEDGLKQFYQTDINREIINSNINSESETNYISIFINLLTKNMNKFALLANFEKIPDTSKDLPFIPYNFNPLQFILCSTLPSLFGYCWCSELTESFIDFIFRTLLLNRTFSVPLMYVTFSNFIRMTTDVSFFRESMSAPIHSLLSSFKHSHESQVECASAIIHNMINHISLLPRHVRRIIRRFFNAEENSLVTPHAFTAICLISPALKQPKEWGIIEHNLYLTPKNITALNNVRKIILEAANSDAFPLYNDFMKLVDTIENVDEASDLLPASQILPALGQKTLKLVFSFSDICMLAYLVRNGNFSSELQQAATKIPTNIKPEIQFVSVEVAEFSQYQITSNASTDSDSDPIEAQFVRFLDEAPIAENAPPDPKDFIDFHRRTASLRQNVSLQIMIQKIESQVCSDDLIPSIDDELQRLRALTAQKELELSQLMVLSEKLSEYFTSITSLFENPKAAYYSEIFSSFLESNNDIVNTLNMRGLEYAISSDAFLTFYRYISSKLSSFVPESLFVPLSHCLHTYAMSNIFFDAFMGSHQEFMEYDKLYQNPPPGCIEKNCVLPAPQKVRVLMEYEEVFEEARALVREARAVVNPLLALPHIAAAIGVIMDLFIIEYNASPQADELTPLIQFLLLTCGAPSLYSFVKFLETYLYGLTDAGLITIPDVLMIGLTHIVNHNRSLEEYINDEE